MGMRHVYISCALLLGLIAAIPSADNKPEALQQVHAGIKTIAPPVWLPQVGARNNTITTAETLPQVRTRDNMTTTRPELMPQVDTRTKAITTTTLLPALLGQVRNRSKITAPPVRVTMRRMKTKYTILNKDICSEDTDIIIWVHTAPKHVRKRAALRLTWGNTKDNLIAAQTAMVFFVGSVEGYKSNVRLQNMLYYENEMYRDIVQEDYIDSYRNMSYKAISGARWVTNHCPQAKLVIKADDDAMIDLPCLLYEVRSRQAAGKMMNNTLLCKAPKNAIVYRGKNKWRVTRQEYAGSRYPQYCQGLGMIITADMVPKMYREALRQQPMWIDDVWMFGMVMRIIGAQFINVRFDRLDYEGMLKALSEPGLDLFFHVHSIDVFHELWRRIVNRPISVCNSYKQPAARLG